MNKDEEIHIVCRIKCKAGAEEQVKQYLNEMATISRAEEGCLYYDIYQEIEDTTSFYFLDGWKNQQAVDEHLKNPKLPELGEKLMPLYIGRPELTYGKKVSVK